MRKISYIALLVVSIVFGACSSVSNLEPDDQLYTGLVPIQWDGGGKNKQTTQSEVETALSLAPNRSLFGSSYHRNPFSFGIYIWNACSDAQRGVKKWFNKCFGTLPVTMRDANIPLHTMVAQQVLANNGYFHGEVSADIIEGKPRAVKKDSTLKPRSAKIRYHVRFGPLFTLDTITYRHFPDEALATAHTEASLLHTGDAFSVATLEAERNRIAVLLRNNGYYFFRPGYITYEADTLTVPEEMQLQVNLNDSLDSDVMRRWTIGNTSVRLSRTQDEALTDSVRDSSLTLHFGGKKSPLRPQMILDQLNLQTGSYFSQDAYMKSLDALASQGLYSSLDIDFAKRPLADSTETGEGILDMTVRATLDRPWSLSVGAKALGKSNRRLGPGFDVTLSKANLFRGGERLSLTAGTNYEFQLGGVSTTRNSYDFSLTASLDVPRLLLPSRSRHRGWYSSPTTTFSVSGKTQRRAGFFTKNTFNVDFTYTWQPTQCSTHKWTPLAIVYGFTNQMTEAYWEKIQNSIIAIAGNFDEMTPRMQYTYNYTSPATYRHPIFFRASLTEAGSLTNLLYMAGGRKWNEQDKEMLGTRFSQYVKVEADFRKRWQTSSNSSLVFHAYGAYLKPFGNDSSGPFSEQFTIGGANDLRGFSLRTIGPGSIHFGDNDVQYLMHIGDLKFFTNLEYRPKLFGSLYGALFLDAGNVWFVNNELKNTFKAAQLNSAKFDLGIDVGVGLRYDLGFFVFRLDWGFAIHRPYNVSLEYTEVDGNPAFRRDNVGSGFFNVRRFKEMQCLNLAIGYPF